MIWVKKLVFQVNWLVFFGVNLSKAEPLIDGDHRAFSDEKITGSDPCYHHHRCTLQHTDTISVSRISTLRDLTGFAIIRPLLC